MELYYVTGTVLRKNVEETELRAVPAKNILDLFGKCNQDYIRWSFRSGPFKMSDEWETKVRKDSLA